MTETLFPAIPEDIEAMAEELLDLAQSRGLRLATAESCTGGLLSALLTDMKGAAHVFDRGFVTYDERAKSDMLGVDPVLISRYGAVSAEVAMAMAQGALERSHASIVCAITGFAGPGGAGDEPGLVHFACGSQEGVIQHREKHFRMDSRGAVRLAALRVALSLMLSTARLSVKGVSEVGADHR